MIVFHAVESVNTFFLRETEIDKRIQLFQHQTIKYYVFLVESSTFGTPPLFLRSLRSPCFLSLRFPPPGSHLVVPVPARFGCCLSPVRGCVCPLALRWYPPHRAACVPWEPLVHSPQYHICSIVCGMPLANTLCCCRVIDVQAHVRFPRVHGICRGQKF